MLRTVLLSFMLAALAAPLPWTLLVNASPAALGASLRSAPLIDHGKPPELPTWSVDAWWRGDFQRGFEPWFASVLEPRGWVIRRVNQFYYSAFRKSYMYEGQIIVGREHMLHGLDYVESYCGFEARGPSEPPPALMADLERLSRTQAARGGAVVFVVSASKTEAHPDTLPEGICRRRGHERPASRWVAELRRRGVTVIDGPTLLDAMAEADPVPPFPRGGVHWSSLAAKRVAARVVEEAHRLVPDGIGTMQVADVRWDAVPEKTDADFASLLNLRRPPLDYAVGEAEVRCRPVPSKRRLIGIGGSFLLGVLDPIVACGLFSEVEYYNYYDVAYRRYPQAYTPVDRKRLDWRTILAEGPVLVLEVNESIVGAPVEHLEKLMEDVRRITRPEATARGRSSGS